MSLISGFLLDEQEQRAYIALQNVSFTKYTRVHVLQYYRHTYLQALDKLIQKVPNDVLETLTVVERLHFLFFALLVERKRHEPPRHTNPPYPSKTTANSHPRHSPKRAMTTRRGRISLATPFDGWTSKTSWHLPRPPKSNFVPRVVSTEIETNSETWFGIVAFALVLRHFSCVFY